MPPAIQIPQAALAAYCKRHHIQRLAFFGSVLRPDFTPKSDVDVLVEFQVGHSPGLLGLAAMERELSGLLGRQADLNTAGFLHRAFANDILREAQDRYVAA